MDTLQSKLDKTAIGVHNGTVRGLALWATDIQKTSKGKINKGARSGIQHSGLPRRSSKAGEPPARQSGRLAASIFTRSFRNGLKKTIGSRKIQARWEYGFGKRANERPFLRTSIVDTLRRGVKGIAREISRSLK